MSFDVNQQILDVALMKDANIPMYFNPNEWSNVTSTQPRVWVENIFPPRPRTVIPKNSGVYAFVVVPSIFSFDIACGLLYIGKAKILYNRIASYILEIGKDLMNSKRPHIWKMVNKFNGHLRYYYTVTNNVTEAEELEEEMLKAFMPYYNRSFDAETSIKKRAF